MDLSPKILDYLRELTVNNNRDWFHEHKENYQEAKALFELFVAKQIEAIALFDSHVKNLHPKDCVFRIHRDIRFSKDKTPYKIYFGAYMARGGRKSPYAGYYTHIEPDNSFVAGGLHCPDKDVLHSVRMSIHTEPQLFSNLLERSDVKKVFPKIYGDKLKTAPKGFDRNLPHIDYLRHKSFDFVHAFSDEDILSNTFFKDSINIYKTLSFVNEFFNKTIHAR